MLAPIRKCPTEVACNTANADVVPLQVSGTIDTEMATITAREMMAWGLNNLWEEGKEGGYAVRHGNQPVSDFGRPRRKVGDTGDEVDTKYSNFFEKAYPCLYPYGEGGIEGHQEVPVDFVDHIRWSLRYHDRRFRKHETFPFVSFGILQRRQATIHYHRRENAARPTRGRKQCPDIRSRHSFATPTLVFDSRPRCRYGSEP